MDSEGRVYEIIHQCLSKEEKFQIRNDKKVYLIRSNGLLNKDQMFVYDESNGNELIEIRKESDHLHSRYNISSNKKDLSTIHIDHSTKRLEIDSIDGFYHIEHLNDQTFQLKLSEQILFHFVKKNHLSKEKSSKLIIYDNDEAKDPFYISIVIVIYYLDRCHHFQ